MTKSEKNYYGVCAAISFVLSLAVFMLFSDRVQGVVFFRPGLYGVYLLSAVLLSALFSLLALFFFRKKDVPKFKAVVAALLLAVGIQFLFPLVMGSTQELETAIDKDVYVIKNKKSIKNYQVSLRPGEEKIEESNFWYAVADSKVRLKNQYMDKLKSEQNFDIVQNASGLDYTISFLYFPDVKQAIPAQIKKADGSLATAESFKGWNDALLKVMGIKIDYQTIIKKSKEREAMGINDWPKEGIPATELVPVDGSKLPVMPNPDTQPKMEAPLNTTPLPAKAEEKKKEAPATVAPKEEKQETVKK